MSGLLLSVIHQGPPKGWRDTGVLRLSGAPEARTFLRLDGLRVIAGLEPRGGKQWAHVSCSFRNELPSWEDLKAVKEIFLGDVMAYQVLPPKAEWLNVHPYTLHLFHCLSGDPFPDCFGGEE